MKFIFVFCSFIFFGINLALGCTIIPKSFCATVSNFDDDLVAYGSVTSIDDDGFNMQLITIFRGEEKQKNIRIWDGTDFSCNGVWSLSASHLGKVGDTLLFVIPKIVDIENAWDQIDDYRIPDVYAYQSFLKIENGVVSGLIDGYAYNPPEERLSKISLEKFVETWDTDQFCSLSVANKNNAVDNDITLHPNPIVNSFTIQLPDDIKGADVGIYSLDGREVMRFWDVESNRNKSIPNLMSGLYVVVVRHKKKVLFTKKVVKL